MKGKTMKIIVAVLLAVAVSGCSTVLSKALEAGTTGNVRFKADDVDKAIEIAKASKDPIAEGCYTAIRKHVDVEFKLEPVGPVSAYAAARVRVREARAGLAPDVQVACSPLILDAAEFSRAFAAKIGRVVP